MTGFPATLHSFRSLGEPTDIAPPLFTGDIRVPIESGYETENKLEISQTQPYPLILVSIMPEMRTHQ